MSKTTDEIICKLLKRVEAEEQAKACLESDLMYASQENMELKRTIKELEYENTELKMLNTDLKCKQTTTKLNEQQTHDLLMYYASESETNNPKDMLDFLNQKGFISSHKVKDTIYEER